MEYSDVKRYTVSVYEDGTEVWHLGNLLHRDHDKPAFIHNRGTRAWYFYGELHRETGPALIRSDGSVGWFLNGQEITEDEFNCLLDINAALRR